MDEVKVTILGVEYGVAFTDSKKVPSLKENNGTCDTTTKKIYIKNDYQENDDTVEDISYIQKKVLMHEIIHAFLYESGLSYNCEWAENEEIVDWMAIQLPKIVDIIDLIYVN